MGAGGLRQGYQVTSVIFTQPRVHPLNTLMTVGIRLRGAAKAALSEEE